MSNIKPEELSLVWGSIKEKMTEFSTMSSTAFDLWFSDFQLVLFNSEKVVFSSGSELKRSVITSRYMDVLTKALENVIGYAPIIEIICDTPSDGDKAFVPSDKKYLEDDEPVCSGLNPDYTFENFIVGSSNQFAHAAAIAVADNPASEYNPLFIYGPSGLGKTHLMYAIANKVRERLPEKMIICAKGEEFMNELIDCISRKTTRQFRDKYRKADMLLIDDIQFIAGKVSTQEEFFHTFNALYEDHRQIIVTSDRPPKEMFTLEDRIKSRFEQGLIADIQPPNYELRMAILKTKAEKSNLDIPNDVLTFLAERLNSNIRQIEGAIKKIGAVSFLHGVPISLDMVKTSVPEFLTENKPVAETVDKILSVTARKYDVSVEDILGTKRTKSIKTARNVAMYVTRRVLNLSLPVIGKMMNRDHSTVYNNCQMIEQASKSDSSLENEISEIIKEIKS